MTIPLSALRCNCANLRCHTDALITLYVANAPHMVPMPTACTPASARPFSRSMYEGTVRKNIAYMFRRNLRSFWPSSEPSPAHISPFTSMNSPTPGTAPFTRSNTIGSVVKYLLIKGMHATRLTSSAPNPTPTLRKFMMVSLNARALSRRASSVRPLASKTDGTKDWATWDKASTNGVRQQKMEKTIWCPAMSNVPRVEEATWDMAM
mmetsp:Transcript_29257/g.62112  ORF Transcript_29257/g.62112 Transcript_29257/m.62112 type:complete len:207 (-) Transcript_29257:1184-1804(-)